MRCLYSASSFCVCSKMFLASFCETRCSISSMPLPPPPGPPADSAAEAAAAAAAAAEEEEEAEAGLAAEAGYEKEAREAAGTLTSFICKKNNCKETSANVNN